MTAPIEMAAFAATVTRPAFFPAATHPDPPIPTGPWAPSTDSDFPHAVDPALAGWEPPTLDDLGLTTDPVAHAARLLTAIDELKARMTPQQLAELRQYEQTSTRPHHLRSAA